MKKSIIPAIVLFIAFLVSGFVLQEDVYKKEIESKKPQAKVYFTKDLSPEGVMKVFRMLEADIKGKVGVKVHFGEEGNQNYIKAEMSKLLVDSFKANYVETNVLYVSKRRYTESHIQLAKDHGFTFGDVDILNAEGEKDIKAKKLKHFKVVKVGNHMDNYDHFIVFSHFKGHGSAGFGGAIKNVSMGFASIAGKMAMHSSAIPTYKPEKCTKCMVCVKECPAGAITVDPLKIDTAKCIGCGKCIGLCPERLFGVPWGSTEQNVFHERLVEYAKVITEEYPMVYINVLANISRSCDCSKYAPKPFMDDVGIIASIDIVAADQASHDLVDKAHQCDDTFLKVNRVSGKNQLKYAEELGMGSRDYILIEVK